MSNLFKYKDIDNRVQIIKEEKKWGLYNTFENPEKLDELSEIDIWKKIDSLGGSIFWSQHDAGKLWAANLPIDTLINAQYNLQYLVYYTKKFGVKFDREPSASEYVQNSESYRAWFEFWHNHFESMSQEEYSKFVDDKFSGKDISKYMPKNTWQDYYKKSVLEKVFGKYDFEKLKDLIEKISPEIVEIINVKYDNFSTKWTTINAKLKNGLNLKVLINEKEEMDWITFYFKNETINLEQVEFMLLKNSEHDFNKIVRHDYFTVDNDIATTFNSSYTFVDEQYKDGLEQKRKVKFKDIKRYAGKDNLANFAAVIDGSKNEILYKDDKKDLESPQITAIFLKR